MNIELTEFHDQLVRGLTHRMNNILSLFHGYVGLLMENQKLDPHITDGLERIKEGACAASELMDRTRALAKPTSLVWRQVELEDFVRMLKMRFDEFCERDVTIKITVQGDLPPLWADLARLRTALIELVRNACDASPDGGVVEIRLGSETAAPGGANSAVQPINWVSIEVIDSGEGVPEAIEAKIFQPFFSTKTKNNPTGLGLTVALGLVQQLGGVIRHGRCEARTIFRLLLPSRAEH